ncbi:dethiobiotin synthetase [Pseudobutyrivibrio sp. AR14]|uniref:dethiobiotin synthase n=1 Tax=Pseudobutyrivibrio sp. AR14 TaxID=1520804 RepID=UPI00088B689F|nr:dethiobiotin synthase [Pseudobutyrivibrio sp. AR14]SCY10877.1 dethiobiotin synthetase [Pseudobutyrivibrio sp. AR14]
MTKLLELAKCKKGVFITGTGTDIGKTYVTALLAKYYREQGIDVAYYKAAISGADTIPESDAGYVKKIAGLEQSDESMVSYLFSEAVSPHLAAKINNRPIELDKIVGDYQVVRDSHQFTVVEGSGGIVCPIRYDESKKILLPDIVNALGLSVIIVADAGLGTIHNVVTTAAYIKTLGIEIEGVLLNNYTGDLMQKDNYYMIEELTGLKVIGTVAPNGENIIF